MVLLELFSGMGGFSVGFENAGSHFDKVYFSEIDKHAIANFKYNFPNAEHIGSVTEIADQHIERPDIITFGSPCQDFSVAGKGEGLLGSRSSLIGHAVEAVRRYRPTVFVWENVKGLLFQKHRTDLWQIIKAFADIGGYRFEWQLLNTDWFLPQNRERIYFVGRLDESCSGSIFPIQSECGGSDKAQKTPIPTRSGTVTRSYGEQGLFNPYVQVIPPGGEYIVNLQPEDYKRLRLLTPIECERLQGFSDDFTRYGDYDGEIKEISAINRYSLTGNAVSVPVVEQVAQRIKLTTTF